MLTGSNKLTASSERPTSNQNASSNDGSSGCNGSTSSTPENHQQIQISADSKEITSGTLTITLTEINSWSSGSETSHQYSLSITNTGDTVTAWTVTIPFDKNINFQQGRGGIYSASGKTLSITNESYNGTISSGGVVKDIGFIVGC